MPPTWYVAADFQCHIVSLLLLILVWKHHWCAKSVLAGVLFATICISFIQNYVEGLDPLFVLFPEWVRRNFQRNAVLLNKQWHWAYPTCKTSTSTVFNSRDVLWPWRCWYTGQSAHHILMTNNQYIPVKVYWACAWMLVLLFSFVFCLITAVHEFDCRLLIDWTPVWRDRCCHEDLHFG
jgi:hypothetical protein